ncbi:MAG: GUN4 domain-containing protein [Cyanobacteriota bacterium]|nr:GUN4 domain-containing protein [Cyanobacteriota bacterium]
MSDDEKQNDTQQPPQPQTPSVETERKIAQKFVSGTTQAFIQWMPLGGSGGLLLSFLLNQEWVKALITFPVTIATVVWARYTEGFLTQLGAVYQERGKNDANSLMTFLNKLDETMRWQLAGTKNKYLQYQKNDCLHYTTEGVAKTFKPLLKDVFVPLGLSGDFFRGAEGEDLPGLPGFKWDKEIIERLQKDEGLKIWDVLSKGKRNPGYRHLVIQAWGGYGKTTLLRHITYTYTSKTRNIGNAPDLIPVLLYLRQWQSKIISTADGQQIDLPSLIEKFHIPNLPKRKTLKLPPKWVKNQLQAGQMLVMLDGLDEVKEEWRDSVMEWIKKAIKDYDSCFFILTSRPSGYRNYVRDSKLNSLFVQPLSELQQERFIRSWYLSIERHKSVAPNNPSVKQEADRQASNLVAQLQESSELSDLSKNPLLLNIIVKLHSYYSGEKLPKRRIDLYAEICRMQLGDRPLVKKIDMLLDGEDGQKILQELALYMVKSNQSQIDKKELLSQLKTYISNLGEAIAPKDFLQKIEEVSELLVKRDWDYEFAHLSFQGYLAAVEIKEKRQEDLLRENWDKSWWRETIILYTAQLKPAHFSQFVYKLLEDGSQKAGDLAYNCWREYSRQVDRDLISDILDVRCRQLEDYLKSQQWQEADRETWRVMLQTVGREEDDFLRIEDIENFPCEDLRKIDQLWVRYSNGKFGFSVQKQIYQSLGGTKQYDKKVWIAFGEKVGWKQGEDVEYKDLTIDLASPLFISGHLPFTHYLPVQSLLLSRRDL